MASRAIRRGAVRHRHWILVALCLGLAFLPLKVRRAARGALLDAHAWLAALVPGPETDGADAEPSDAERLLAAEVTRLRRALVQAGGASDLVQQNPDVRLIPADVLPLKGGVDVVQRVALSRGRVDGVSPGLPVVANGTLVGRVATVTESTCEVLLITDPTFKIRATLARPDGEVEGLLVGDGSDRLRFEPIVLDETARGPVLAVGETVVSSRASVLCGVGAVLGVVERVVRPPGAGTDQAIVRPTRNLDRLDRVVIVRFGDDA